MKKSDEKKTFKKYLKEKAQNLTTTTTSHLIILFTYVQIILLRFP